MSTPMIKSLEQSVRLLTVAEVAERFRPDPKTVSRWAKAGRLPPSAPAVGTIVTTRPRSTRCCAPYRAN
jgi:hypothetical protein